MSQRLLYQFEISPYCTKVRAVLAYKGLDYSIRTVGPLSKKDIKFSKIGKVPILSDGEEIIEDSTNIVLYLEEHYPTPPLLPKSGPQREAALRWEEWADEHLPVIYQYITFTRPTNTRTQMRKEALAMDSETWEKFAVGTIAQIAFPLMLKQKLKVGSLHDLKDEVHRAIHHLEASLEGKPFLLGKTISLPDVVIHGFANNFRGLKGDDLYFGKPNIKAWDTRVAAAIQKTKQPVISKA